MADETATRPAPWKTLMAALKPHNDEAWLKSLNYATVQHYAEKKSQEAGMLLAAAGGGLAGETLSPGLRHLGSVAMYAVGIPHLVQPVVVGGVLVGAAAGAVVQASKSHIAPQEMQRRNTRNAKMGSPPA